MIWGYMLLGLILGGVAVYTVIPDLFLHRLGVGSWRRQYGAGVALTFDDGPDPMYTPRVLDVLRKYQVSATFFVVAERAKEHPALIRRILEEGHTIGVHSLKHRYAWFTSPAKTWREWTESVRILEEITGGKIVWMRPPWGTFNLVTWWWLRQNQMRAVLWNAEGHDWERRRFPADIVERILKRTDEGTIIVLHDSGGEKGAPDHSILALDHLCERILHERKLPIVGLEFPEWSFWRRLTFRAWELWEHYYARKHHVERIDAGNILRLEKTTYDGPDLYNNDGSLLARKGDIVAEIHIDSIRLQEKGKDMQKLALKALRQARDSFPGLTQFVAENPAYGEVKVFLGVTLIHRGVKGFGFHVQDLPNSRKNRGIAWLQKMIMRVYHPAGSARGQARLGDDPKLVWISREELIGRWGKTLE